MKWKNRSQVLSDKTHAKTFVFKASINKIDKKELAQLGQVDIEMNGGDLFMWLVKEHHFRNLLFNLFSGNWRKVSKRGFEGKVLLNGVDICRERSKEEFIYIGRAESIPEQRRRFAP